jgi:hypothetical protein
MTTINTTADNVRIGSRSSASVDLEFDADDIPEILGQIDFDNILEFIDNATDLLDKVKEKFNLVEENESE